MVRRRRRNVADGKRESDMNGKAYVTGVGMVAFQKPASLKATT